MSEQIGGGGEWTALREALLKHNDATIHRRFNGCFYSRCVCGAEFPGTSRKDWVEHFLEALAAAAPAPPAKLTVWNVSGVLLNNGVGLLPHVAQRVADELNEIVAPPPQDGQGSELLGPPRGGSSSDLAEQLAEARAALSKLRMSHCDWAGYLVHKEDETHSILEYDEHCPKCVIDRILKGEQ